MFRKILIANRGEIAVRIQRACRELGIRAVAVYSDADRASLHVRLADEAYRLGPAPSRESYLAIDKVLDVARAAGCDAMHPATASLRKIMSLPAPAQPCGNRFHWALLEAMAKLGSKTEARRLARRAGVPTVPGGLDPIGNLESAITIAKETGFPVVLKAVAGGGGKGMRLVEREAGLPAPGAMPPQKRRTLLAMAGCTSRDICRRPRHIEIQVLGDRSRSHVVSGRAGMLRAA